jgi:RNA polymerase sigma-70 factor, ECF subfamily
MTYIPPHRRTIVLALQGVDPLNRFPPADAQREDPHGDDRRLMECIRSRKAEAMNELLRKYWSGVLGYVERFSDSRDSAEDTTQELFLQLWEGKLLWKGTGSVRAFLYGSARNLARNRGRGWREVRVLSLENVRPSADAPRSRDPHDVMEEEEVSFLFSSALATLPSRRQEIFILARVNGLSYKEIADTLGVSVQTVANQVSRALADLRAVLRPKLEQ